ncbi:MAG TPA: ribosome maturation factor RimM [Mycobacteriales bacterium]
MRLVVGRVGRAHGVTGEVAVTVRTDDPDTRFAPGSVLVTEPEARGPLRVDGIRWHSGRLLVTFADVADRTAAEALRGTELVVDTDDLPALEDPEEFYDHQLVGLTAVRTDGRELGQVSDVIHGPAGVLLAVRGDSGAESLIPFVRAIVPAVDLAAARLTVDPPEGLLDL